MKEEVNMLEDREDLEMAMQRDPTIFGKRDLVVAVS